jgi:hypothetical protein
MFFLLGYRNVSIGDFRSPVNAIKCHHACRLQLTVMPLALVRAMSFRRGIHWIVPVCSFTLAACRIYAYPWVESGDAGHFSCSKGEFE